MQIGNALYIDLEIVDLDLEDFLTYADVNVLQIVETAGASLPYIYMAFLTKDKRVVNSFQQGNKARITIGNNESNADTFEVEILPTQPSEDPSTTGWLVEFTGFIGSNKYMIDHENKTYAGNSLFVVNNVITDYFGKKTGASGSDKYYVKTDFSRVNENQILWRRNHKTACSFVADTLLHCDVRPSFPLFSFDKYKNFYIKDLNKMIKEGPKYNFVTTKPTDKNTFQYLNNFNVNSYQTEYNLYSGYNKVTEIFNAATGLTESMVDENKPILAASTRAEESYSGNLVQMNDIQSTNVHKTYNIAYVYNTNKLMALSSMMGCLVLIGDYHKELKPLDLINVSSGNNKTSEWDGSYIIDTIVTEADITSGSIKTLVYVTRDNKNNVEDYLVQKPNLLKILTSWKNRLLNAVHSLKVAYAMGKQIMDGDFMDRIMSFAIATKRNLLRSFRVSGVSVDFNSSSNLLTSLIATGNSLMNSLVDMVFPTSIAFALQDFIIYRPSAISLISKYASQYIDAEVRDIFMLIAESLFSTTNTLNSIAKDNGIATAAIISGAAVTGIAGAGVTQTGINASQMGSSGDIVIGTDASGRPIVVSPAQTTTGTGTTIIGTDASGQPIVVVGAKTTTGAGVGGTVIGTDSSGKLIISTNSGTSSDTVSNSGIGAGGIGGIGDISSIAGIRSEQADSYIGSDPSSTGSAFATSSITGGTGGVVPVVRKVDPVTGEIEITEGIITMETSEVDYVVESQQKVSTIMEDFENNTTGLDIPFPVVKLTESQALLPEEELRDLVAEETIENLDKLNYLKGVDKTDLKAILLGEKPIDFNLIKQINRNTGSSSYYRFWGSFSNAMDLVSPNIKKAFKDKYKTLPCTKFVSALRNSYIFFACPKIEENVKFYINSRRTDLEKFDLDLGYTSTFGAPLMYTVYYTPTISLYAWSAKYNNNVYVVYTKTQEIDESTILFNSDKSEYIGEDFEIAKDGLIHYIKYIPSNEEAKRDIDYDRAAAGFNSSSVLFEVKQGVV